MTVIYDKQRIDNISFIKKLENSSTTIFYKNTSCLYKVIACNPYFSDFGILWDHFENFKYVPPSCTKESRRECQKDFWGESSKVCQQLLTLISSSKDDILS